MYTLYLETCGAGIGYISDIPLDNFFERISNLEVPGIKTSSIIPSNCSHFVYYKNNLKNTFYCDENNIYINYDKDSITDSSIIRIGLVLLEKALGEKKKLILHSACVSYNDSAILLLGRSGSGKTSLALNLCDNYGYKLMSNDRTIIGINDENKICCFEGTKYFTLRYSSIFKNCPKYLRYFEDSTIDPWLNKKVVSLEQIGIAAESRVLEVQKSFLLHIDNDQELLYNMSGNNLTNRLFLNEFFQMGIRGMYSTFLDKDFNYIGYMPSLDNEELYSFRVQMMNSLLQDDFLEYISGNLSDVSNYVFKKRKKDV